MCCFKDVKNFERMNNIVQVAMNMAIMFIVDLPFECQEKANQQIDMSSDGVKDGVPSPKSHNKQLEEGVSGKQERESSPKETGQEEKDQKHECQLEDKVDSTEESKQDTDKSEVEKVNDDKSEQVEQCTSDEAHDGKVIKEPDKAAEPSPEKDGPEVTPQEGSEEKMTVEESEKGPDGTSPEGNQTDEKSDEDKQKESKAERDLQMEAELRSWSLEEKDRLFHFITKIFLMNFPLYVAYKHSIHTSLEELSQQEASALNNYCELSVGTFL